MIFFIGFETTSIRIQNSYYAADAGPLARDCAFKQWMMLLHYKFFPSGR